jgi:hypothetical protein
VSSAVLSRHEVRAFFIRDSAKAVVVVPAAATFIYGSSSSGDPTVGNNARARARARATAVMAQQPNREESSPRKRGGSYESTDAASKGIVSSLTALVNAARPGVERRPCPLERSPPSSPDELLERIRDDYLTNNYLWTGNLDASCYGADCLFNDPTLSFRGIDAYKRNVENLRPIVEAATLGSNSGSRSDLLSIVIARDAGYIETRWNMVGDLHGLPWKPRVDVVGRTKFWYEYNQIQQQPNATVALTSTQRTGETGECVVVHYDEEWEIPAYQALLQLVTPSSWWRLGPLSR